MKRVSAESCDDEDWNQATDLVQQDAKRPKLSPFSDTTLQDLPIELLADVLAKAVAMEVTGMKFAKSAWKEKADLVISRLRTVCWKWNSILSTNFFRLRVGRILDDTAQDTFRLKILHQSQFLLFVVKAVAIEDKVFMLCKPENQDPFINVHDRNSIEEAEQVIPLPGTNPVDIAASSVSNCLYVLSKDLHGHSIVRISTINNEEHHFSRSPWPHELIPSCAHTSIFPEVNGGLITLSQDDSPSPAVVSTYDTNGSLQRAIKFYPAIYGHICTVIPKSNGHVVLVTVAWTVHGNVAVLKEVDGTGRITRRYSFPKLRNFGSYIANQDRIWLAGDENKVVLLDSELNPLDLQDLPLDEEFHYDLCRGQNSNERDEILNIFNGFARYGGPSVLTIFRFTEK